MLKEGLTACSFLSNLKNTFCLFVLLFPGTLCFKFDYTDLLVFVFRHWVELSTFSFILLVSLLSGRGAFFPKG